MSEEEYTWTKEELDDWRDSCGGYCKECSRTLDCHDCLQEIYEERQKLRKGKSDE